MSYQLNEDQDRAMTKIQSWLDRTGRMSPYEGYEDDWMFCLAGYAGTGKTFLLSVLINSIDPRYTTLHCVAPTGKAAAVLMSKLEGVTVHTIHSLLYLPVDDNVEKLRDLLAKARLHPEDEELKEEIRVEVEKLNSKGPGFANRDDAKIKPGDLVICDESSMVDTQQKDDLRKTGARVLFVGDDGQLPPVGDQGWFLKIQHDAKLETIQRQSLDSPIIRLSMDIREGYVKPRDWRRMPGCGIWKTSEVDHAEWLKADQIITGANASRHKINRFIRKALGHNRSLFPVEGEKLICLKNDKKRPFPQFVNGTIFKSNGDAVIYDDGESQTPTGVVDICYDSVDIEGVQFYAHHCEANYKKDLQELPRNFRNHLMELDFAYAITVHKSQGSEWPYVIVADDEMQKANAPFRRRWLYTAVTRAKSELKIIQPDK